jgi:hypothetical protein
MTSLPALRLLQAQQLSRKHLSPERQGQRHSRYKARPMTVLERHIARQMGSKSSGRPQGLPPPVSDVEALCFSGA